MWHRFGGSFKSVTVTGSTTSVVVCDRAGLGSAGVA
jgi:hypothetical protein